MSEDPPHDADPPGETGSTADPLHPASIAGRGAVDVVEKTNELPAERFEPVRDHYDSLAGKVQVGIVDDERGLLLMNHPDWPGWTLPGADVPASGGWSRATRAGIAALTGVEIAVEGPRLLERTTWRVAGDGSRTFVSENVFAGGSPTTGDLEDPGPEESFEHDLLDLSSASFEWFRSVPDDAHPNHRDHLERFL